MLIQSASNPSYLRGLSELGGEDPDESDLAQGCRKARP